MGQELLEDLTSGHNVVATVYVNCHQWYWETGPDDLLPVGETDFIAKLKREFPASLRVGAGLVGEVDLLQGFGVKRILEAHLSVGNGAFRGVRPTLVWHKDPTVRLLDVQPSILQEPAAHQALSVINELGLSLDLWLFFTQLDEALLVARKFPGLSIVINHTGGPIGIGPYRGQRDEVFQVWRNKISELARCPNVVMKLGGMANRYGGWDFHLAAQPPSSDTLVDAWRPWFDACIECFGPERCMFESNFPVDKAMVSYNTLWNAYKKYSTKYSDRERYMLLCGTAETTYRI